jgi:protein-S-isoprenylcysteine O-methyltransferase Ste14
VPDTQAPERAGLAVAEPEAAEEFTLPSQPKGSKRFDEIVTPHPVVAFLFRRRTFIVLLAVAALVFLAKPNAAWLGIGVTLAVLAEAWRIWAAGTIHKSQEVTTGGPYAYVRHPLYVGSFLHSLAYCFMSGRWESFLLVPPLFFLVYGAAVSTEEAMLHTLFGEQYGEYCKRVPRFFPRLGGRQPGNGQFSWAQVWWNREWINILWVVLLSTLFAVRLVLGR